MKRFKVGDYFDNARDKAALKAVLAVVGLRFEWGVSVEGRYENNEFTVISPGRAKRLVAGSFDPVDGFDHTAFGYNLGYITYVPPQHQHRPISREKLAAASKFLAKWLDSDAH